MLLGYDKKTKEVKFIFTDEEYLDSKYPDNTAKISNFWGSAGEGLTEFFIPINEFQDWTNYRKYKIENGQLIKTKVKGASWNQE